MTHKAFSDSQYVVLFRDGWFMGHAHVTVAGEEVFEQFDGGVRECLHSVRIENLEISLSVFSAS